MVLSTFLRIELVPFLVNLIMTVHYLWKFDEPGKIIYWLGATVLTVGLYIMKG